MMVTLLLFGNKVFSGNDEDSFVFSIWAVIQKNSAKTEKKDDQEQRIWFESFLNKFRSKKQKKKNENAEPHTLTKINQNIENFA